MQFPDSTKLSHIEVTMLPNSIEDNNEKWCQTFKLMPQQSFIALNERTTNYLPNIGTKLRSKPLKNIFDN